MIDRKNATDKFLNKTVSAQAVLTNKPIEEALEPLKRKRAPKIETKYRGRIYLVSGEKGGVGKTIVSRCLIEHKRLRGINVIPIEADVANLDIERLFRLSGHVNLQIEGGYIDLLNHIQNVDPQADVIVSLPAGALAGADVRGAGFLDGLPNLSADLSREVIVVWPIDDKMLSVEMLRNFVERCPGMRIDVVGNSFFHDKFEIYENSETKKAVELTQGHFLSLPRLHPQVMQTLVNDELSFDQALNALPIGAKYEFQRWLRLIDDTFEKAGYYSVDNANSVEGELK